MSKTRRVLSGLVVMLMAALVIYSVFQQTESTEQEGQEVEGASFQVAALKGPTAMGMVNLMKDVDSGVETVNDYAFIIAASADEITPKLVQGEIDIACVPANLAAVLHQRLEGDLQVLAINTLGVLYIVENGNAVRSMEDLRGKTIVSSGKGATPEYALRYLLSQNGIDPDLDVIIDWKSEHTECVTALASGAATIALLPQPFVTVAQSKLPDLRMALDLTQEWETVDDSSALLTGVVVARKSTIDENPGAIDAFLKEYEASVAKSQEDVAGTAALIGQYDIVDAAIAEKALPYCNIVCITGEPMQEKLSGYLSVLMAENPQSVGGALPDESFYYGA